MAEADSTGDNGRCLSSSSIVTNLLSWFETSNPVNDLITQIQNMKLGERLSAGFAPLETAGEQDVEAADESSGSLIQLEDRSPPTDLSSALGSVDLLLSRGLENLRSPVLQLFSVPSPEENNPAFSPLDQDESTEGAEDPAGDEVLSVSFQSKYIHFFPLYQDYCLQAVRDDLHRLKSSFLSELITPQYLQGFQAHVSPRCHSEATPAKLTSPEAAPSSPLRHPIRVTPCTLWQDLDEVKASGLLSTLTAREIRLQETMFELIGSEASYLRSLGVAVNHFYASKALRRTLSQMEHHILFSNIRHVMAASEKFLMDLEVRLGERVFLCHVGDVVLKHCSQFHSLYVPYVTNMMYQETLISRLLEQSRDFVYSVRKLERDPVCQRRNLKSFLVLPFQRITRIKLILESILKLTEPDSDSISNLKKAIEAIHEIVTDCEKGVRKMKQIEELICLETLLDFGKIKSLPLVVSGRFLVHQGPARQLTVEAASSSRVSFSSVYLHLFNDLLIISSKKNQRFAVVDHADFPTHVHLVHLKSEVLGLPPTSFLLHLSQSQSGQATAVILVTDTMSDKEAWMKALSKQ